MGEFVKMCELLGLSVDPVASFACEFLESRGEKFLVDFGTENALAKAVDLYVDEIDDYE